jgi:F-type H+-transporting ATPase subunit alpha
MLKIDYVRFKELEKLTRIKAGKSADVDERLRQGKILEAVLKQDQNVPVAMEDQVMLLFALQNGLLKSVNPADVDMVVKRYIDAVRINRPEIVEKLVSGKTMTDEIAQGLKDELIKFQNSSV